MKSTFPTQTAQVTNQFVSKSAMPWRSGFTSNTKRTPRTRPKRTLANEDLAKKIHSSGACYHNQFILCSNGCKVSRALLGETAEINIVRTITHCIPPSRNPPRVTHRQYMAV